jgi:hypothetical protein
MEEHMIVKSENKRTLGVWVGWLIAVGFVAFDLVTDLDWVHFAGGATGIVIWALIAYATVGLPFISRKGN